MRSVFLALALLSTPAIAADQFDLVCTSKAERQRYRIDLARSEWCAGKCDLIQKIASVNPGMIALHDHQPAFQGDQTFYNRINRVTGEWEWFNLDPRYSSVMDIKGTCEAAPFSGFLTGPPKF